MTSNPYAPPSAPVNDAQPQALSLKRPAAVDRACTLLWCSVGLSILSMVLENMVTVQPPAAMKGLLGLLLGVPITLWFTTKLKRGRNWMRVVLTTLTVLGVLMVPFMLLALRQIYVAGQGAHFAVLIVNIAMTIVRVALIVVVTILINLRAAKEWFQAMRDRGYSAA